MGKYFPEHNQILGGHCPLIVNYSNLIIGRHYSGFDIGKIDVYDSAVLGLTVANYSICITQWIFISFPSASEILTHVRQIKISHSN